MSERIVTGARFKNPHHIPADVATFEAAWPDIDAELLANANVAAFSIKQLKNRVPAVANLEPGFLASELERKGVELLAGAESDV